MDRYQMLENLDAIAWNLRGENYEIDLSLRENSLTEVVGRDKRESTKVFGRYLAVIAVTS